MRPPMTRRKRDRPWSEYPIGTRAYAFNGGHWQRVERGWKWCSGDTFPTPSADAIGKCVLLPEDVMAIEDLEMASAEKGMV